MGIIILGAILALNVFAPKSVKFIEVGFYTCETGPKGGCKETWPFSEPSPSPKAGAE